jgi:EmrB/QacA subfamily drug resistance transporter
MIFAVSMTFIDMTIVSIAVPEIQRDLGLSSTGIQWVVNGYLLSLAALFAFGGRLADIAGHRRMVLLGVVIFAVASTLNGLTPDTGIAEAWLITFRLVQGAGAAIMFPAALAIVVKSFPLRQRGQAMAIFFGVAGGLTSVGPLAGGYLSEWTWRAIFWVNIPVAIIAVILTLIAKPSDDRHPAPIDVPGLLLVVAGMGLSVLGLQQASSWGWTSPLTWGSIGLGLLFLLAFVLFELRATEPLIRVRIFLDRAFAVQNVVLFISMIVFVPVFFFASMYAQASLGQSASEAGLYLLVFFIGFAPAAQVGGRLLDKVGAKPAVVAGNALAAVGFALWAWKLTDLSLSAQVPYIIMAGAGIGLMLGPANTDAINRAPQTSYGEATGITQTVRNYGSSLGMAVLGTIMIAVNRTSIERVLTGDGMPASEASQIASSIAEGAGTAANGSQLPAAEAQEVAKAVEIGFADATQVVFYLMAGVMAVAFVVSLVGLRWGRQEQLPDAPDQAPGSAPQPATA